VVVLPPVAAPPVPLTPPEDCPLPPLLLTLPPLPTLPPLSVAPPLPPEVVPPLPVPDVPPLPGGELPPLPESELPPLPIPEPPPVLELPPLPVPEVPPLAALVPPDPWPPEPPPGPCIAPTTQALKPLQSVMSRQSRYCFSAPERAELDMEPSDVSMTFLHWDAVMPDSAPHESDFLQTSPAMSLPRAPHPPPPAASREGPMTSTTNANPRRKALFTRHSPGFMPRTVRNRRFCDGIWAGA
jgi:hypothetical protein